MTGRRVRRAGWHRYYSSADLGDTVPVEAAISPDWEVEPIPEVAVSVTRTQFCNALVSVLKKHYGEEAARDWQSYPTKFHKLSHNMVTLGRELGILALPADGDSSPQQQQQET